MQKFVVVSLCSSIHIASFFIVSCLSPPISYFLHYCCVMCVCVSVCASGFVCVCNDVFILFPWILIAKFVFFFGACV